jgi:indoleamine 2,3-dioxygenase
MPLLDGALGIYHTKDHLRHYLNEMRDYMPPEHRAMIEQVEGFLMQRQLSMAQKA